VDAEVPLANLTSEPASGNARLQVSAAMLSHVGCVRSSNEDCVIYSVPDESGPGGAHGVLALVADGMGGHAAGEVASQIATQTIHYLFYRQLQPVPEALAEGIAAANLAIHERGQNDPDCAGMGTTCTAIVLRDNQIWLGHVGDSRAYLVRKGKIYRISEDHSLVSELVRQGKLTELEAKRSPDRNIILRALGIEAEVEPTIWREGLPAKPGDVVVICSDGLSDVVEEEVIRDTASTLSPFEACEALIRAALDADAPDNVSVGVIALGAASTHARIGRTTLPIDPAGLSREAT
jgi:protein phosphatase